MSFVREANLGDLQTPQVVMGTFGTAEKGGEGNAQKTEQKKRLFEIPRSPEQSPPRDDDEATTVAPVKEPLVLHLSFSDEEEVDSKKAPAAAATSESESPPTPSASPKKRMVRFEDERSGSSESDEVPQKRRCRVVPSFASVPPLPASISSSEGTPESVHPKVPSTAAVAFPKFIVLPKSPMFVQSDAKPKKHLFAGISFIVTGLPKSACAASVDGIEGFVRVSGGTLLDDENRIETPTLLKSTWGPIPSLILVSDKPHRTVKYLVAIAVGVPPIHHRWISHCREQGTLLPFQPYLLPSGFSLEKEKNSVVTVPKIGLLRGMEVVIIGTAEFQSQWNRVLAAAGATAICNVTTRGTKKPDCVICQSAAPDMLARAKSFDVPVVSSEWLIQCLVNQKRVGFTEDPHYDPSYRTKSR